MGDLIGQRIWGTAAKSAAQSLLADKRVQADEAGKRLARIEATLTLEPIYACDKQGNSLANQKADDCAEIENQAG